MSRRPALRRLASRLGILPGYVSQEGRVVRTQDATRIALCRVLGFEASTEAACRRALRTLVERGATRALEPARVLPVTGAKGRVPVRWPRGMRAWRLVLTLEDGTEHRGDGRAGRGARAGVVLPARLPLGYHTLELTIDTGGSIVQARQRVIVVPRSCPVPGRRRVFGLSANLYTVRSRANWGIGDTGDLRALVRWGSATGAAFIGLNPLHALGVGPGAVSPYSPVSRLYREPLYVDVTRVPEFGETPPVRRYVDGTVVQRELRALRAATVLDYERVRALKRRVLGMLYETFVARHRGRGTVRGRAYAAYCKREGQSLAAFARHMAAVERRGPRRGRMPRSADAVGFHCWLQFELDRQLAAVARTARTRGLSLGLYHDLALGSAPGGSDGDAFPGLFVDGAHLGAPPDDYARTGQDWGLPPLDPHRLADDGYRYWTVLLRRALAHARVLRIDHVMGLVRQYWIPRGRPGTAGAYVRFPSEALLGILALEATRAGAVIVGEDIGTVPPGFRNVMRRWGMLSTRVLYFERTANGGFRASRNYPARAIASVNNHDLPPLAGWWQGRDLELRASAGLLARRHLGAARRRRREEQRALVRRLTAERCLRRGELAGRDTEPDAGVMRAAAHRFLRRTPAALVALSLDDLGGEVDPVNLPGTATAYPSWRRRMRRSLEELTGRSAPREVRRG